MEVDLTGKLTKEDYEQFVPATDKLIKEHGKVSILFVMHMSCRNTKWRHARPTS